MRRLRRMVSEDRCCGEMLGQVGTIRRGLNRAARAILEEHVRRCARDRGDDGQALSGLARTLGRVP